MARIKRFSPFLNLTNFQVFINDSNANSQYFRVNEISEIFTGGKNGFLIEGTPFLRETTEVKIEILDVNGKPIYVEPGDGAPEYYEGLSKLVSVHVYDDTPIGVGKITILGELKEYVNGLGQTVPVPAEWVGAYNVKWERDILINRNLNNETIVRFFYRPQVTITEFEKPVFEKTIPIVTHTGSVVGVPEIPVEGTDLSNWGAGTLYKLVRTEGPSFSSSMDENTISLPSIDFSPRIIEVLNDDEVLVNLAYTDASNIVRPFTATGYTSSFEYGEVISESTTLGSFAKIDIRRLETFVGDVARVKIFRKSRNTTGDYTLVQESKLESTELLKDVTTTSNTETLYGFFNLDTLQNYWQSGSDTHPLSINYSVLSDSVKVDYDTISGGVQTLTTVESYTLTKDIEYTLSFRTILSGSISTDKTLRAYVSSSTTTQDILTLVGSTDYITRETVSENVIIDTTADAKLVFEFTGDDWYISNVSFRAASDTAFSPDEFFIVQNVPRKLTSETFDFRFEFYDINNNYIPVDVFASKEFTAGNDFGGGTTRLLIFESTQNAFRFSSGSLASPPFQQIQLTTTANGTTGSVTYYSSAFDIGGNYIDPTEYMSQSLYEWTLTIPEYSQSGSERFYSASLANITFSGSFDDLVNPTISGSLVGFFSGSVTGSLPSFDNGTLDGYFSGSIVGSITSDISGSISGIWSGSITQTIDSSSFTYPNYPGLLTNASDNGATLLVSNFTGSLSSYTIGSILYTASVEDLVEYETIFRLEDGENAPSLIVTSNANQFIYEPTVLEPKPAGQTINIRAQRKNLASLITPITVNSSSLSGNPPPLTFVGTDTTRGVDTYSITALEYSASNADAAFPETTYQFSGSDVFGNVYFDEVTISPVINFDGISVVLSNETNAFRANSIGTVTSTEFDQGDGTVDVRIGGKIISHSEGLGGKNVFDIISASASTGLTANEENPTTNAYGISAMSVDSGSLDLLIRYEAGDGATTVDFTKKVTYTKARSATPNVVVTGNPLTQGITAQNGFTNVSTPSDITFNVSEAGTTYSYATTPTNPYEFVITSVTSGTNNNDGTITPTTPSLSGGTIINTSGSVTLSYIDSEGTTTTGYTQDFSISVGVDGRRSKTGVLNYQISSSTPPATPTATLYSFADNEFTGLTANWGLATPTFSGSNQSKYWNCVYDATEDSTGAGVATSALSNLSFGFVSQSMGFAGLVTFSGSDAVTDGNGGILSFGENGETLIKGDTIVYGSISSNNYSPGTGGFSNEGMSINLLSGSISSSNFSINNAGDLKLSGSIYATAGYIGGWSIIDGNPGARLVRDTGTNSTSVGLAPDDYPFYAGRIYDNRASAPFRVTPAGAITATSGTIGGWTLGSTSLSNGNVAIKTSPQAGFEIFDGSTLKVSVNENSAFSSSAALSSTGSYSSSGSFYYVGQPVVTSTSAFNASPDYDFAVLQTGSAGVALGYISTTGANHSGFFGSQLMSVGQEIFVSDISSSLRTTSATSYTSWAYVSSGTPTYFNSYHWIVFELYPNSSYYEHQLINRSVLASGIVKYENGSYTNTIKSHGPSSYVSQQQIQHNYRFRHIIAINYFEGSPQTITARAFTPAVGFPLSVKYGNSKRLSELNTNGLQITNGLGNSFTVNTSGNASNYLSVKGNSKFEGNISVTGSLSIDSLDVNNLTVGTIGIKGKGLTIDGDLRATGEVYAYSASDKRLKDNLIPISDAIRKLNNLTGYEFDWNIKSLSQQGHDYGVVAQEVQEILPEIVGTRSNNYLGVKYEKIIPLLIQAIKEQQVQIDELKKLLNN